MSTSADIEIFVRDCNEHRLVEWMRSRLGILTGPLSDGATHTYDSPCGPIIVTPAIESGPFTGVWFNTTSSPWKTELDCARDAARALDCTVRCDPGTSVPGLSPLASTMLEVTGSAERLVDWT